MLYRGEPGRGAMRGGRGHRREHPCREHPYVPSSVPTRSLRQQQHLCQGWAQRSFPGWGGRAEVWVPPAPLPYPPVPQSPLLPVPAVFGAPTRTQRWDMQSQSGGKATSRCTRGFFLGGWILQRFSTVPVHGGSAGGGVPGSPRAGHKDAPCPAAASQTHRDHAGLLKYHLLQWSLPG